MYQHYKPLRNYLSKHSIHSSLEIVWRHVKDHSWSNVQRALHSTSTEMLPWELELVAREIILNGHMQQQTLASANTFDPVKSVQLVRQLTMHISKTHVHSHDEALSAVIPLIHQQMPWSDDTFSRIARYGQIYRHQPLAEIMQSVLKISLSAWLKLGLAVFSLLVRSHSVDRSIFFHLPGVDRETVEQFFALTTRSIEELGPRIKSQQVYDRKWAYVSGPG